MRCKSFWMFFLILLLSPIVWSADLSGRMADIQSLRSQLAAEQKQLHQACNLLENLRIHYAAFMGLSEKSVTSQEWVQAVIAREDAKANAASLTIAVANVSGFIQLVNAQISKLKSEQQKAVIQNNHVQTVFLQSALLMCQRVLALERARLVTLRKWVAVETAIVSLNQQWCERLLALRQEQRHHLRVSTMLKGMYRLQTEQSALLTQISAQKNNVPEKNNEYAAFANYVLQEKVTLNRLSLFLAQLQFRAENLMSGSIDREALRTLVMKLNYVRGVVKARMGYIKRHVALMNVSGTLKESKIKTDLSALEANYTEYVQKLDAFQAQLQQREIQASKQYEYNLYQRESLSGLAWFKWRGFVQHVVDVLQLMGSYACSAYHYLAMIFQGLGAWWFGIVLLLSFCFIVAYFYLYRHLTRVIRYLSLISRRFSQDCLYFFFVLLKNNIFIFPFILFFIAIEFFVDFDFRLVIDFLFLMVGARAAICVARMLLLNGISEMITISRLWYVRLRLFFVIAATLSFCVVMAHQLPVDAVVRVLFNRVFMLVLLVLSILLFRAWFSFPILLQRIFVVRRSYIMNAIRLFCRVLPVTLFSNAIIGLVGYVELAWLIGRVQVIALIVLFGYLVARGLIFDFIELCYEVTIRYVKNGWLWTQVALKPLDKILRLALLSGVVWVLIVAYHLNHNQRFLLFLKKIFMTPLIDLGGNLISLMFCIKTIVFVCVLYWVGKWSREYAFRSLYVRARDIGLRNSLAVFTQYAIVALGMTIALKVLGLDFTGLAFVAAAFAAGIGFGLRDLANNFFSGILLLVERPFRAGDRITIGPYEGEIISTGMRSMKVRTSDHVEVIVPNSDMFTKPFVNWTLQDSIVRSVISIRLDRVDDPHSVQNLIYGVLKNCRAVVEDPAPEVFMTELSESLIQMEVRYCINLQVDPSRSRVRSEVLFAIWDCFQQHGIHPPYPHVDMVADSVKIRDHGVS